MRLPRHLAATIALAALAATPAMAASWSCSPDSKLVCSGDRCDAEPPDAFRHAESFSFDGAGPVLAACLWTDCYEGDAHLVQDADPVIASGRLLGRAGHPVDLTLAIDADGRFTAVWQLSGSGATISGGRCTAAD